jgi:TDG/mug DNA glycosylase family protein
MLARADGALVRSDHERLPFADESLGGVWSRHSCVHTPHAGLPMLLREFRRTLPVGAPLSLSLIAERDGTPPSFVGGGDLPGRTFFTWTTEHLDDLLTGAGFEPGHAALHVREASGHDVSCVWAETDRIRSIADTVGAGMRLLVCGLNPSLHAADAGIGFVTPGNRFWPAAIAAGLASKDRDPEHALRHHGLGMTDLVKRATPRAAELTRPEYAAGLDRLDRLCRRLDPGAVCFVGLAGWRAAADRNATAGPQMQDVGGRPVYVMPSTSGLNASSQHADFVDHFRAALALADRTA